MVLPAAYLGLKAVQNPGRVGGIVAIAVSVILLLIGGTLLAVGVGKTPTSSGLVTGGAIALAIGLLVGAIGLYFTLRKKSASIPPSTQVTPPQVGSAFDETERQTPALTTSADDEDLLAKQTAFSGASPLATGTSVPSSLALSSALVPAELEKTVAKLTDVYKQNPLIKTAIDAAVTRLDKTGQLRQLLQQGSSSAANIQKIVAENPVLASALTTTLAKVL